jgi:hypothetical protein
MHYEKELANQMNGFFDKSYLDKTAKAKTQWQAASNNFYTLLAKFN